MGGLPYGLGLCVSTSAFNQLLKASTECGLLVAEITELDLGFGIEPLTAGLLAFFIPEFGFIDPATTVKITIRPELAPVVTGAAGPFGELVELQVGHLVASVVGTSGDFVDTLFLEAAIEFKGGLDLTFDDITSELVFSIGGIIGANLGIELTKNPIFTNEASFVFVMTQLLPLVLPNLADSLGSFPLPQFPGPVAPGRRDRKERGVPVAVRGPRRVTVVGGARAA